MLIVSEFGTIKLSAIIENNKSNFKKLEYIISCLKIHYSTKTIFLFEKEPCHLNLSKFHD